MSPIWGEVAAALEGRGGEKLLNSYGEERRPIFVETGEAMIAGGIESDRAFLERYSAQKDQAEFERAWKELQEKGGMGQQSYEPHYEGSSVVAGPPNSVCSIHGQYSFLAQAGHHLSPQPLTSGRNGFEEFGPGFTLLAFGVPDEAVRPFQQEAESLRVPLKVVRDTYEGGERSTGRPWSWFVPISMWCGPAMRHRLIPLNCCRRRPASTNARRSQARGSHRQAILSPLRKNSAGYGPAPVRTRARAYRSASIAC